MGNIVYLSYDADSAGGKIGQAILMDDPATVKDVSDRINLGNEIVANWAKQHGGVQYSSGGDQGLFAIPAEAIPEVAAVRADYEHATGLTISVGIGKTLSESGKALIVAKFWGKNMAVQFSPEVEKEIQIAEQHVQDGTASFEEQKLTNDYIKPVEAEQMGKEEQGQPGNHADCRYCQAMEQEQVEDPTHCKYCHDVEQEDDCKYCAQSEGTHDPNAEGHPDDCKYCLEAESHDPNAEGHTDNCQYCRNSDGGNDQVVEPDPGPTTELPTTTSSQDYAGQDLLSPDLPKPDAISKIPDGLAFNPDDQTNENRKLSEEDSSRSVHDIIQGNGQDEIRHIPGDPASRDTVEEIVGEIDELPPTAQQARHQQEQIDAPNLSINTNMEGNVSRPEDYDTDVPGDMGLAEDEEHPDITTVLQEGLDNHASDIQREKVIQLVSEALEGFKSCKDILEKAKEQAPQLYESSIAMLKAMIEMAKMMGLSEEQEEPGENMPDPLHEEATGENLSPNYEQHPENMGAEEHPGMGVPEYEPHPEKGGGAAPADPKLKGLLGSP